MNLQPRGIHGYIWNNERTDKKCRGRSLDIVSPGALANRIRVRFLRKLAKVGGCARAARPQLYTRTPTYNSRARGGKNARENARACVSALRKPVGAAHPGWEKDCEMPLKMPASRRKREGRRRSQNHGIVDAFESARQTNCLLLCPKSSRRYFSGEIARPESLINNKSHCDNLRAK